MKREVKLFKAVDHIDVNLHVTDEDFSDNQVNVKSTEKVSVTCVVTGGYPKPKVSFVLINGDDEIDGDFSEVEEVLKEDSEDSTFSASLTPTTENQGYFIGCKLEQFDHEDKSLAKEVEKVYKT